MSDMPAVRTPARSLRTSLTWDETDCLRHYGMLSLQEIFHVVGSQLTEADIEVLSFLLDENFLGGHPLSPANGMVARHGGAPGDQCMPPELLSHWRRFPSMGRALPKSGPELLLELERRGYLSDGNLEPLLQLLRVLTRHDLLPFVSHKKRRTVSPERAGLTRHSGSRGLLYPSRLGFFLEPSQSANRYAALHLRNGYYRHLPATTETLPTRRKKKRGHNWSRRAKRTNRPPPPELPVPEKVTCEVRLRVRAEYLEHDAALLGGRVSSDKPQLLERQFELFSRASLVLRYRDLGSIYCDIKFDKLENLEAFWGDYLSGALLEALKGVFITDSLRRAAGREDIHLLISVDQDDYEDARKALITHQERLNESKGAKPSSSQRGDRI